MLEAYRPLRHDDPEEHWHFTDEELAAAEDIDGIESFKQQSVGIDIGSSTSHLIFSELVLRRDSSSSRFVVAGRRLLYRSAILLTPYKTPTEIDTDRLLGFIERAYESAGVDAANIDAGAVVITGEALKKENARPILERFSREAGKFICASAGPHHEALLAAHGSGAVALSRDNDWRVLVIDIGGGTTKLGLIADGKVQSTAAINIGARLVAFDDIDRLTRIEEPARLVLGDEGNSLALGEPITLAQMHTLTRRMVDSLFDVILGRPYSTLTDELMITEPLVGYEGIDTIDRIVFSGGVSEYVYGRDSVAYGDLGPLLGRGIRARLEELGHGASLATSPAGIRATVIGAGEYTVQASGNTTFISNPQVLPIYAMPVIKPDLANSSDIGEATAAALRKIDLDGFQEGLALALELSEELTYPYLRRVVDGIATLVGGANPQVHTLFLILAQDVARTIGSILKEELALPAEIVAIDGIDVGELDYVDIGQPVGKTGVVPVTVKSLVFPTSIKLPAPQAPSLRF